ncbi:hypothetical protein WME75_16595 [Sorangium sp. So ce1014]|uniref:hypothetical protein n=1 Tax=Sorangium sp. So ce1014 TaxID=3133326 RepID=UPI003F640DC7
MLAALRAGHKEHAPCHARERRVIRGSPALSASRWYGGVTGDRRADSGCRAAVTALPVGGEGALPEGDVRARARADAQALCLERYGGRRQEVTLLYERFDCEVWTPYTSTP